MKCHWCNKQLETVDKKAPHYLECPDIHALITLAPPEFNVSLAAVPPLNQLYKTGPKITEYILYHDISNIRYKIHGIYQSNMTLLFKRIGAKGHKLALQIKFFPLRVEDDVILMEPLLNKLKKLVIFS